MATCSDFTPHGSLLPHAFRCSTPTFRADHIERRRVAVALGESADSNPVRCGRPPAVEQPRPMPENSPDSRKTRSGVAGWVRRRDLKPASPVNRCGQLKKSALRSGALVGEVGQGRLLIHHAASHWQQDEDFVRRKGQPRLSVRRPGLDQVPSKLARQCQGIAHTVKTWERAKIVDTDASWN